LAREIQALNTEIELMWRWLQGDVSEEQKWQLQKYGFTLMNEHQLNAVYGRKSRLLKFHNHGTLSIPFLYLALNP
jgi:hypothetical protein